MLYVLYRLSLNYLKMHMVIDLFGLSFFSQ